ncbi:MAG: hypothetical protein AB1782_12860 [Cyanobacteriota bacterium]
MTFEVGKSQAAQFHLTSQATKKQEAAKKDSAKTGGENFVGEKGDQLLAFLGIQGQQHLDLSKQVERKPFDLDALTAKFGELDDSTKDGLGTIAKNLPAFSTFTGSLEASGKAPGEVLDMQNAFLQEFKA